MNCQEFLKKLDQQGTNKFLPEELAHLQNCPSCRIEYEAEQKLENGLEVLSNISFDIDVSKNVINKIAKAPKSSPAPSLIEKISSFFSSLSSMQLAAGATFSLLIIIAGIWQLTLSSTNSRPPQTYKTWVQMANNKLIKELPYKTTVKLSKKESPTLTLRKRAIATLSTNSTIIPKPDGMKILLGTIKFKVNKSSKEAAFKVVTPHGQVKVLGTEFIVGVSEKSTEVSVISGKVEFKNEKTKRILQKKDKLKLPLPKKSSNLRKNMPPSHNSNKNEMRNYYRDRRNPNN
jgi:hypothetical protein